MAKILKITLLRAAKFIGLFRLARYLTRRSLRILCYHNFDEGEGVAWEPRLFMRPGTFRRRMAIIARSGYPVLRLGEAVRLLGEDRLPPAATVITIDDGWFGVMAHAHGILHERAFSYTVYVTSYYSANGSPIFNLAVQYMFRKTPVERLALEGLGVPFDGGGDRGAPDGGGEVDLSDRRRANAVMNRIIEYGQARAHQDERDRIARRLGGRLRVDFGAIEKSRFLSLMTAPEIETLARDGTDVQLHTHRHRWPLDREEALREIADNRSYLEPLTGRPPEHFCYPSGEWTAGQFPFLEEAGMVSATTCDAGLNNPGENRYALKRFLDSESVSPIEFEAELSGFLELLRKLRPPGSRR